MPELCPKCEGNGTLPWRSGGARIGVQTCSTCEGAGWDMESSSPDGSMVVSLDEREQLAQDLDDFREYFSLNRFLGDFERTAERWAKRLREGNDG